MNGPLTGVRILDVSRAIAGPYGAMLLADLGAEVIHIEPPEGDISRFRAGPNYKGESFHYLSWNRNKKDIVLDLATKSGKEAFLDLVRVSDIVWDNFRAGSMKRLGLDYESLVKIKPDIICVSITGYGPGGPFSGRPAFDVAILGHAGVLSVTGEPDGVPVRPGPPVADMGGAVYAAIGALAALAGRGRTGKGRKVDVSMQDTSIALLSYYFCQYFVTGKTPGPLDHSGHTFSVPYGIYKTKKGYVAIGPSWPKIVEVIGLPSLAQDPRFTDWEARDQHRAELNRIIEERLADADADEWIRRFAAADVPAGEIKSIDQVVEDPQVAYQKMVLTLPHPLGGEIRLAGNPIKMNGMTEEDYAAPPLKNQHEREILAELLGYSDEKIEALRQEEKRHTEERLGHVRQVW